MNEIEIVKPKRKLRWIVILLTFFLPLSVFFWNAVQNARDAAEATHRRCLLKQIGAAFNNYHDVYGTFPPAYIADNDGKPMHSWRVLILPFMGEDSLYSQYDFSEPWDGPNNIRLLKKRPYYCDSQRFPDDETETLIAAIVGKDCVFVGAEPIGKDDIPDGSVNTIIIGEVEGMGIPWTAPRDVEFDQFTGIDKPGSFHSKLLGERILFLTADGSANSFRKDVPVESFKARFTRNGGEQLPDDGLSD